MGVVEKYTIVGITTDPIYIGTGGYTIGRVDNTIVRDPISNLPKIPGSSVAGTWRYYVALELNSKFKDEFKLVKNRKERIDNTGKRWFSSKETDEVLSDDEKKSILKEFFGIGEGVETNDKNSWLLFPGNAFTRLKCAGQDDAPQQNIEEAREKDSGHCGHCIVCKGFGFSKRNLSWQGMLFFSDLEILFFPVFTMEGTKWVTTERIIEKVSSELKGEGEESPTNSQQCIRCEEDIQGEGYINLGWLYLPYKKAENRICEKVEKILTQMEISEITAADVVIVPEKLFPHIVNSNLEVRTSVSIDPLTGAAKEKALFTSEAIPRGTILWGEVRIFNKSNITGEERLKPLPSVEELKMALEKSAHYYESLGIGGMTTRGFGRLKMKLKPQGNSADTQLLNTQTESTRTESSQTENS